MNIEWRQAGMWHTGELTNGGDEIQEAFLREERVLQASEVQLQNPGHWVYIMIILIINKWVFA